VLQTAQRFRVVPFELCHLDYFNASAHVAAMAAQSHAKTLWDYQYSCPSVVVGIMSYWPGVGMAWMHYNQCPGDGAVVARFVKRELLEAQKDCRRIEAYVVTHDMQARRFIEWLGFVLLLEKPYFSPTMVTMTECALTCHVVR
jgi:hypothetical protein